MCSTSTSFLMSSASSHSAGNESPFHSIVKYIDDYMDLVDNVPNDIARQITQLHENNHRYHQLLSQLDATLDVVCGKTASTESKKRNALLRIQRCLIEIQEIADEKLLLIQSILDQLDGKARQLDFDYRAVTLSNTSSSITNSARNMTLNSGNASSIVTANHSSQAVQRTETTNNIAVTNTVTINTTNNEVSNKDSPNGTYPVTANGTAVNNTSNSSSSALSGKRASARRNTASRNNHDNAIDANLAKRSVKRGVKGTSHKDLKRTKGNTNSNNCLIDNSPPPLYEGAPIDPDEPTYCLCEQVSFGEMICCDNSACSIEWFHFSCVSLNTKPKGKWYCPNCRGERSNIPKK